MAHNEQESQHKVCTQQYFYQDELTWSDVSTVMTKILNFDVSHQKAPPLMDGLYKTF